MKNLGWNFEGYGNHYKKTIQLAIPICMSHLGHVMVGVADSMMVGNFGGEGSNMGKIFLAAASLANSLYMVIMVFGIGITFVITSMVAAADGENNDEKLTSLLKHSLVLCIGFGVVLTLIFAGSSGILKYFGQPQEVVDYAIPYFNIMIFSLLPLMVFLAVKQFTEGLSDTKQAMFITVAANLLNVFLNYVFIYGKFGFSEMGLNGAGYSTFISRIIMMLMMIYYVYKSKKFIAYRAGFILKNIDFSVLKRMLKLGIPMGFQFTFEVGAFAAAAVMIGWISASSLAAHQIAINLASITYMIASGVASAATVRVGKEWGRRNFPEMIKAANSSWHITIAFMLVMAVVFLILKDFLPTLYNKDPLVLELASSLLIIAALFQISDGTQAVGLGIFRGLSDVKLPTLITFSSYWLIGLPVGYLLAFHFNLGVHGIWYGLLLGLTTASALFMIRFYSKTFR
jgi:multidrug resistance protein, MATE family